MKHPDYDRAFPNTPDEVRAAIELGIRKGQRRERRNRTFARVLAAAATLLVILGAGVFGASRLAAPRPERSPLVPLAAPSNGEGASASPEASASDSASPTPGPSPVPTVASTPTPEPTVDATQLPPLVEAAAGEAPVGVVTVPGGTYRVFDVRTARATSATWVEFVTPEPTPLMRSDTAAPTQRAAQDYPISVASEDGNAVEIAVSASESSAEIMVSSVTEEAEGEASQTAAVSTGEAPDERYPGLGLVEGSAAFRSDSDACFHLYEDCAYADGGALFETTVGEALARDLELCPDCGYRLGQELRIFFYTPNGQWYHIESDCSGMRNAQAYTLDWAVHSGKPHCPVCIGDDTSLYWLRAPEAGSDRVYIADGAPWDMPDYYHINPECFGMTAAKIVTLDEAREEFAPCPACLPELAGMVESVDCYATGLGKYYHVTPNCSGMEYALRMTELEAQAQGKLRCPVCGMNSAAVPEGWSGYRPELGGSIADAFLGFAFEREDVYSDRTTWFISDGGCIARAVSFIQNADGTSTLLLDCGGFGGLIFWWDFIERLPEPLSAVREALDPNSIRTLWLECGADGALTGFCASEYADEPRIFRWTVDESGSAALVNSEGEDWSEAYLEHPFQADPGGAAASAG